MAYAELAGLPAVVGLWASVGALLSSAVLGSSGQLSVGPESTQPRDTAAATESLSRNRDPGPRARGVGEHLIHWASRSERDLLTRDGCPADLDDDLWADGVFEEFVLEKPAGSVHLEFLAQGHHREAVGGALHEHRADCFAGSEPGRGVVG